MKQRQLIFDSLNKIVTAPPQKNVGHSKSSNGKAYVYENDYY